MEFPLHSIESAPDAIKAELEAAQKAYKTIPNLYRGLASAPAALKIYVAMSKTLAADSTLTPVERQVVALTISAENGCTYCVGAHSVLAVMARMPKDILAALRAKKPLPDDKLEALRRFSLAVLEHRGWTPEAELAAFEAAGYKASHVLEVITILAQKIISTYFNHLAETPQIPCTNPMPGSRRRTPRRKRSVAGLSLHGRLDRFAYSRGFTPRAPFPEDGPRGCGRPPKEQTGKGTDWQPLLI